MSRSLPISGAVAVVILLVVVLWMTGAFAPPEPADPGRRGPSVPDPGSVPLEPSDSTPPPVEKLTPRNVRSGPSEVTEPSLPSEEPMFVIEGQVLDDDGYPLPGAVVRIYPYRPALYTHQALALFEQFREEEAPLVELTADEAGYFRAEVARDGEYLVQASGADRATAIEAPVSWDRTEPEVFIFFTLSTGLTVAGTLVDETGRPLPDVELFLLERLEIDTQAFHTHRVFSRSDGTFEFQGLAPRRYILMVQPDDRAGRLMANVVPPRKDLELQLRKTQPFRGRVVDSEQGRPIGGVQITAVNREAYDQTHSAEDGTFELKVSGADVDCIFRHSDYLQLEQHIDFVGPTASRNPTFEMDLGVTIRGQLRREDGTVAAGIEVGVQQAGLFLDDIRATRTDAEGYYRVSPVDGDPDKTVVLLARDRGWAFPLTTSTRIDDDEVQPLLVPTEFIEGVVEDEFGRPLSGAWVRLIPGGSEWQVRALQWLRGTQETWTGNDGRFVIDDVIRASGYLIEVSHPERVSRRVALEQFPGDAPVQITLTQGGTLTGTVRASRLDSTADYVGESMVPRVLLVVQDPGYPPVRQRQSTGFFEGGRRVMPRTDGTYHIDQLPAGPLTFYVQAPGYLLQRHEVVIRPGETQTLDIELYKGSVLRLQVQDPLGQPRTGLNLVLTRSNVFSATAMATPTGAGIYEFSGIAPGTYRIYQLGNVQRRIGRVVIPRGPDQVVEQTIRLKN